MSVRNVMVYAAAVAALAGCNKNNDTGSVAAVADDTVTISQARPAPGSDWSTVVNATPSGYMMGNPDAKVKLVEIGSLFCPFCKKFEDENSPLLVDKYVKNGDVSWEFRPYVIHGPIDVAANIVARCSGVKSFFPLTKALYKDQATLLAKVEATPQDKIAQIQNLPTNQVFVQMASLIGLQDWAAERGVPQAKSNQCLSDQKMIDREVQLTTDVGNQYPDFTGTPAFIINGKMLPREASTWDKLEPELQTALK